MRFVSNGEGKLVLVGGVIVLGALLACKEGSAPPPTQDPATTATATAAKATGAKNAPKPAKTQKPKAATPSDPALAAPNNLRFSISAIPAIPSGRSNPPRGNEWDQGIPVNTQGAATRAKKCTMHVLREWLRIFCTGDVVGYEKKEDFGKFQSDYYEKIVPGKFASFVVRLRKGKNPKIRICRKTNRVSLFVGWPPSRDRPRHLALSNGPVCDGSDWGVGYAKGPRDSKRFDPSNVDVPDSEVKALLDQQSKAADACEKGDKDACIFWCGMPSC